MDSYTLSALGIKDDIHWMANRIGWGQFLTCHYPTYPSITLEFLSSLSAEIIQGKNCEEGLIKFRLKNIDYRMNLNEFNEIFDFPNGGERQIHRNFCEHTFWREIALDSMAYDASRSKSSNIPNPIFRYLHRFMANTIFGRWDSVGVARLSELQFLWAMINEVKIDSGAHLVRHLVKIGNSSTGVIVIGGLLTKVALALGCDLEGLEICPASPRLDLDACLNMRMIGRLGEGYCLMLQNDIKIPLPNYNLTTIHNTRNWLFKDVRTHDLPTVGEPSHPAHETSSHVPEPPRTVTDDISAGPSIFDFSGFRTSFEGFREEHTAHRSMWEKFAHTSEEHYQRVERYMEGANRFYSNAEEYFAVEAARREREEKFWQEEREFREEQRRRWQEEDDRRS